MKTLNHPRFGELPVLSVDLREAKTEVSRSVDVAGGGKDITIVKAGEPAAILASPERVRVPRCVGPLKGMARMTDDFYAPS